MSESGGLTRRTESLLRALRTRHGRRDSEYCFCDGLRASREIVTLAPELIELVILREGMPLPGGILTVDDLVREVAKLCPSKSAT